MTTKAIPLVATTTTANLEELRANVTTIAEKITALKKASPVDKDAMIGASVKELLDAKRTFAQHNNGIGLDGTKWEEPLTKKQKKAKEMMAEKDAAAAAASGVGKGEKGKACMILCCPCLCCWFVFFEILLIRANRGG